VKVTRDEEPSLGIRLLADLQKVFIAAEMATKEILRALTALEEAPWGDISGKPLDARGLANHLRPYGVKSGTVRISEQDTPKGYKRADLVDVWRRYLPPTEEPPQPPQPPQTPLSAVWWMWRMGRRFLADDIGLGDAEKTNETSPVADVADVADFQGSGRDDDKPGLSWRAIDQLARELEDWAYLNRDTDSGDVDQARLELRRAAG
jgi:hypothetical protein